MKKRLLAVVAALAIMTVGASAFAANSPSTDNTQVTVTVPAGTTDNGAGAAGAASNGAAAADASTSTTPATTPAGTSPVTGQ